jgi:transposase
MWKKTLSVAYGDDDKDADIRRLKRELIRVTEKRDVQKTTPYFAGGGV